MELEITPDGVPWQPNASATRVATWHYYDQPLVGVVSVGDERYVFVAEEGQPGDVSIWSYRPITSQEQAVLEAQAAGESFSTVLGWFCGAIQPVRIVVWEEVPGVLSILRRCYECGQLILHDQPVQIHGRAGPVHEACVS